MVVINKEVAAQNLGSGICRKILAHKGGMMSVEVSFLKGSVGEVHSHPHEQITYVLEGSFELNMNGEKRIITKGDSYYTEPDIPHGVTALEAGKLLDIFTPQREDFLK